MEAHWSAERTKDSLEKEECFEARVRTNARNPWESYASCVGVELDLVLDGRLDQNRSVDGDLVAVLVYDSSMWTDVKGGKLSLNQGKQKGIEERIRKLSIDGDRKMTKYIQGKERFRKIAKENSDKRPKARVVSIISPSRRRQSIVGHLVTRGNEGKQLILVTRDSRIPHCNVSVDHLPRQLKDEILLESEDGEKTLVLAKITSWKENYTRPMARLIRTIGQTGEIEAESRAILEAENIHQDHNDFPDEAMDCLPKTPWTLGEDEVNKRRDLRETRIFSIDPITARDLDDALSYTALPDGKARIGVHIADVSHFVPPGSPLDEEALRRSTSVYLVQKVLPMLPRLLCEELCSLNAGVDRCAFSVIWVLDRDGNVLDQWMGKSVIRSCAKLSYEDAQKMLDGKFSGRPGETPPTKLYGPYSWSDIVADVRGLHRVAQCLRKSRFDNGALRLDNKKLLIQLAEDGHPIGHDVFKAMDANRLVEEFMLLANRSVARFITQFYPDRSLLRRHPYPNAKKMEELVAFAEHHGIDFRAGSSKEIHGSLQGILMSKQSKIVANSIGVDVQTLYELMQILTTEPMQLAMYINTGDHEESEWRHFALAFDHYTHFTSPIRRYPDIIVHRLLSASLDASIGEDPLDCYARHGNKDVQVLSEVAVHCNERKLAAKNAQEASSRLFLALMLRDNPRSAQALVVALNGEKFFEVYLPDYGLQRRVNVANDHGGLKVVWDEEERALTMSGKRRVLQANGEKNVPTVLQPIETTSLTVRVFTALEILLCCGGGKGKPLDVKVELMLE